MIKLKDIFSGILGGAIGGAAVDLIFITFIGPSSLFFLMGITGRINVFLAHVVLGGILGVLFVLTLAKWRHIWLAGILWGLLCLGIVGGIPSFFVNAVNAKTTIAAFAVWLLFGTILAATIKFFKKNRR